MLSVFIGIVIGVFLGVGLTAFYLAWCERRSGELDETWIDEAFSKALSAVEYKIFDL